ncbi:MAG: hypothetical protein EU533_01065 [Promethearchaeota archaeon]|nr:MAG: hypothetical protein EU533_01065 [Candidatus Lokiarchaeota archaeon]
MQNEIIKPKRASSLRQNKKNVLILNLDCVQLNKILMINHNNFYSNIMVNNQKIKPLNYYMVINNSNFPVEITYSENISDHEILYDPYLFENSEKKILDPNDFLEKYSVPEGYLDILAKWYSIKFSYNDHNLIFIKSGLGISIQTHKDRSEEWTIIAGRPIVINIDRVHYFVENGSKFSTPNNSFHSVINPSKKQDEYVIIKETWSGNFNENDIQRIFNPNNYY